MERRKFIRNLSMTAAASIAVPTIIPSSALGRSGFMAPSDRIPMVLIGCGGMGQANMTRLLGTKQVECVALCDVHKPRVQKSRDTLAAKGFDNSQKEYSDYRDLLAKTEFDAAVIGVPDHWHALLYTEFANHKKHIYGEKPLVRKIKEGRVVANAVTENNIIWQTGSWQRSSEQFVKGSELVASGAIGKIKNVDIGLPNLDKTAGMPPKKDVPSSLDYNLWLGPAPKKPYRGILHWNWRWMMDYSGGQMTDWVGHHYDIAAWSLDLDKTGPIEIDGTATFVKGDLFDVPREFNVNLLFKNGIRMKVANSAQVSKGMGVCWYGEKGWIHANRTSGLTASDEKILTATIPASITKFRHDTADHWTDFIDGIRGKNKPIADVEGAHRSISAGLLGEIAYLTGEKLKWNPDKEELIGASAKANALLTRKYRRPWKLKGL